MTLCKKSDTEFITIFELYVWTICFVCKNIPFKLFLDNIREKYLHFVLLVFQYFSCDRYNLSLVRHKVMKMNVLWNIKFYSLCMEYYLKLYIFNNFFLCSCWIFNGYFCTSISWKIHQSQKLLEIPPQYFWIMFNGKRQMLLLTGN